MEQMDSSWKINPSKAARTQKASLSREVLGIKMTEQWKTRGKKKKKILLRSLSTYAFPMLRGCFWSLRDKTVSIWAFIWQSMAGFLLFLQVREINKVTHKLCDRGELGWRRERILEKTSREIISTKTKLRNPSSRGSDRSESFLDGCYDPSVSSWPFSIHGMSDYSTGSRSPAMPAYHWCLRRRCWDRERQLIFPFTCLLMYLYLQCWVCYSQAWRKQLSLGGPLWACHCASRSYTVNGQDTQRATCSPNIYCLRDRDLAGETLT